MHQDIYTPDSSTSSMVRHYYYYLLYGRCCCGPLMVTSSSSGYILWRQQAPAQLHQPPAAVHLPASSSSTRIFKFRLSSPVPRQCTVELGHAGVVPVARYLIVPFTVVCLAHLQVLPWRCVWTMSRWTRSTIHCCVIVWLYCIVMPNWVFTGLDHPRDPPGHDIGICHCSGRGEL